MSALPLCFWPKRDPIPWLHRFQGTGEEPGGPNRGSRSQPSRHPVLQEPFIGLCASHAPRRSPRETQVHHAWQPTPGLTGNKGDNFSYFVVRANVACPPCTSTLDCVGVHSPSPSAASSHLPFAFQRGPSSVSPMTLLSDFRCADGITTPLISLTGQWLLSSLHVHSRLRGSPFVVT